MKNYSYHGSQASFAMRTPAGRLYLQRGVITSVPVELDQALKQSQIVQAVIKSGELVVTAEFKPQQSDNSQQSGDSSGVGQGNTDLSSHDNINQDKSDYQDLTVAQIKEKLDAASVKYPSNAKKAELIALIPAE